MKRTLMMTRCHHHQIHHHDHGCTAGGDGLGPDVQRRRQPGLLSAEHALRDKKGDDDQEEEGGNRGHEEKAGQ